jgi:hypothetical protein
VLTYCIDSSKPQHLLLREVHAAHHAVVVTLQARKNGAESINQLKFDDWVDSSKVAHHAIVVTLQAQAAQHSTHHRGGSSKWVLVHAMPAERDNNKQLTALCVASL